MASDPFVDVRPRCTVCLDQVMLDGYALLNCTHVFHTRCIAQSLRENSTCPNCRIPVDRSVLVDLGIFVPGETTTTTTTTSFNIPTPPVRVNGIFITRRQTTTVARPPPPPPPVSTIVQPQASTAVAAPQQTTAVVQQPHISTIPSTSAQFHDPWSKTFADLMSDSEDFDSISLSERSCIQTPAFYETSVLSFLKMLNLTSAQSVQLISFKRRYGKYALCNAVFRVKVFLALDRDFQFTGLEDMLHRCKNDCRSARSLEKIYLKYLLDNRQINAAAVTKKSGTARGSVYKFFDLPQPRVRNSSSILLERSFRNVIQKRFGVTLPVVDRDIPLYNFYKRYPHNLHDVLRYAKLRCKEKFLKKQMMGLKNGVIGCRRKRRSRLF